MDAMKPEELQRLLDVRMALLHLHKALLDGQRRRYEKEHGRVATPAAFLQLAISDPAFHWLHRFSELVIENDESTEADEPLSASKGAALLEQARSLLTGKTFDTAVAGDEDATRLTSELMQRLV